MRGDGIPANLPERAAQVKAQIVNITPVENPTIQQDGDPAGVGDVVGDPKREEIERSDMLIQDVKSAQDELNAKIGIMPGSSIGVHKTI